MPTVWVICGAGRGVGKTHLGLALSKVLPGAVRAKLGHGPRKRGGLENYFRSAREIEAFVSEHRSCRHIVLEANEWARTGRGDVIVYLEEARPGRPLRDDASLLRDRSHLQVAPGCSVHRWQEALKRPLRNPGLRDRVIDLLIAQARFLGLLQPRVRSKIWVDVCGVRVVGGGLAELLEGIRTHGSLREAASTAGMSYRRAWQLIRTSERMLGITLATRSAGGKDGGGAILSPRGFQLLQRFSRLDHEVAAFADRRFARCWRERTS